MKKKITEVSETLSTVKEPLEVVQTKSTEEEIVKLEVLQDEIIEEVNAEPINEDLVKSTQSLEIIAPELQQEFVTVDNSSGLLNQFDEPLEIIPPTIPQREYSVAELRHQRRTGRIL